MDFIKDTQDNNLSLDHMDKFSTVSMLNLEQYLIAFLRVIIYASLASNQARPRWFFLPSRKAFTALRCSFVKCDLFGTIALVLIIFPMLI